MINMQMKKYGHGQLHASIGRQIKENENIERKIQCLAKRLADIRFGFIPKNQIQ